LLAADTGAVKSEGQGPVPHSTSGEWGADSQDRFLQGTRRKKGEKNRHDYATGGENARLN